MQPKKRNTVQLVLFFITCFLSFLFIVIGSSICNYSPAQQMEENVNCAVVVGDIKVRNEPVMEGVVTRVVSFQGKITHGPLKGQQFLMEQLIEEMVFPTPKQVEVGDKILVSMSSSSGIVNSEAQWHYVSSNRVPKMIWLVVLFLALIVIIGKLKGLTTIIALVYTVAAIFCIYIPSILTGKNIYVSTTVVAFYIIISSLLIMNGYNKKTLCAIIGNIGGILISGALALFVNASLEVTGIVDQDYLFLTMLESNVSLDLRAVVWGGILIGSLGAIMDVAMSIASSMQELAVEMQTSSFHRMVHSGMNIGRDAIGTMTNTLILAYVGSSLAVILLFCAYNRNFLVLMNFEMIVVELIQAIVGSIGILLATPITVLFAAWIFNKKSSNNAGDFGKLSILKKVFGNNPEMLEEDAEQL